MEMEMIASTTCYDMTIKFRGEQWDTYVHETWDGMNHIKVKAIKTFLHKFKMHVEGWPDDYRIAKNAKQQGLVIEMKERTRRPIDTKELAHQQTSIMIPPKETLLNKPTVPCGWCANPLPYHDQALPTFCDASCTTQYEAAIMLASEYSEQKEK